MPRIHDDILQVPFFIYPSIQSAKAGESLGGSGFLTSIKHDKYPSYATLYAVTNEHVVSGCGGNVVLRLNTVSEGIKLVTTAKREWHKHSTHDIALCPLELDNKFAHKAFPSDWFMTDHRMKFLSLGIGDDTFMVGRFVGHEGKQKNLPTVRFGNISMMPDEPIKISGKMSSVFLVECRSIPGYSGSPVFAYINPNLPRPPNMFTPAMPVYNTMLHGPWLIGIDSGHIGMQMEVTTKTGKAFGQAEFNSAMAAVVPAWNIMELLNIPELVKQREKDSRELTEKIEKGLITLD